MKMTKAEWAAILVTIAIVMFTAGFFVGRNSVPARMTLSEDPAATAEVSPAASPAVSPAASPEISPAASETPAPEGPLDLNAATPEQLETLPGIGEVMARRIIDYRTAQGGFRSVEELKNVSGIGEKTFEAIKDLVKVEDEHEDSSGG